MIDDFGARDIWPFCPWPQARRTKRGVKAEIEIKFARKGDIDDVVELVPAGTTAGVGHRLRVVDPLSWYAGRKPDLPMRRRRMRTNASSASLSPASGTPKRCFQ